MSRPRPIVPGTTYLVTRRCTQRQFLLLPGPVVNRVVRYCAALAQQATSVQLHTVVAVSNHYHLVLTDTEGRLPDFVYIFDKYVAKCLNAYRGRWENFFAGGTQPSYVALPDESAMIDKSVYAIVNPVAAGLVRRHEDWPGVLLFQPGRYKCLRPDVFFRENGPTPESLKLEISPVPISGGCRRALELTRRVVKEREAEIRRVMRAEGRKFLGVAGVLAQNPFASPRSAEPRRGLSPRVACRDKWRRIEALLRFKSFEQDHRDSSLAFARGDRNVLFPAGTFLMRVRFHVRCAET